MQYKLVLSVLPALTLFLCGWFASTVNHDKHEDKMPLQAQNNTLFEHVEDIPVPDGFKRESLEHDSFGNWLRKLRLKKDNVVYLFDGRKKKNQSAQYAVLDVHVGSKDLQQCADAVMRLKAEYLFSQGKTREIVFIDNAGKRYSCPSAPTGNEFEKYLEKVFAYCGTGSLSKQLLAVPSFNHISSGNVLIKGGFPGHAVIVLDVAMNKNGQKIFLLAQSYMPAQSIHILKNPLSKLSPWYPADTESELVETPEWTFSKSQLMEW